MSPTVVQQQTHALVAEQVRSVMRRDLLRLLAAEAASHSVTVGTVVTSLVSGNVNPSLARLLDREMLGMGIPREDLLRLARESVETQTCELDDLIALTQAYQATGTPLTTDQAQEIRLFSRRLHQNTVLYVQRSRAALEIALSLDQAEGIVPGD